MNKHIKVVKTKYTNQISLAKVNGYNGVMVPVQCDYDLYNLDNIDDIEYIYDMALESGWDKFVLIDFINGTEKLINLYEYEAA